MHFFINIYLGYTSKFLPTNCVEKHANYDVSNAKNRVPFLWQHGNSFATYCASHAAQVKRLNNMQSCFEIASSILSSTAGGRVNVTAREEMKHNSALRLIWHYPETIEIPVPPTLILAIKHVFHFKQIYNWKILEQGTLWRVSPCGIQSSRVCWKSEA
jgi:hypothetical protein